MNLGDFNLKDYYFDGNFSDETIAWGPSPYAQTDTIIVHECDGVHCTKK